MQSLSCFRLQIIASSISKEFCYCKKTGPVLYAPTSSIEAYRKLGIDCYTLADNYITDAGGHCLILSRLFTMPIQIILAHVQIKRRYTCMYNIAETMYNATKINLHGALYTINIWYVGNWNPWRKYVIIYSLPIMEGRKIRYPSPQTRTRFHRMADSGADMILS